jgi:hypothetical protein
MRARLRFRVGPLVITSGSAKPARAPQSTAGIIFLAAIIIGALTMTFWSYL